MADPNDPGDTRYPVGSKAYSADGMRYVEKQADGSWSAPQPVPQGAPGAPVPSTVTQQAEKHVESLQSDADLADSLSQSAQRVQSLAQHTTTGGAMGLPIIGGPIAQIAGIFDPPLADMNNSSLNMAKSMRAQGQRLTQAEWARNLSAVPGPEMSNQAINDTTKQFVGGAQMAAAKAAFFNDWVNRMHTDAGALPAWEAWKNKNFDSAGNYHAGGVPAVTVSVPGKDGSQNTADSNGGWSYVGPAQN